MENNIVSHIPISRSWKHPGTFVLVFLFKQRIANDQIQLVAQAQEMQSIALPHSHSMFPQSPPCDVVIPNSGIKVIKNNKLVILVNSSDGFSKLRIEVSDILTGGIQGEGLHTDKWGVSTVAERKVPHHNSVRHTLGNLIPPLDQFRFNCKANPGLSPVKGIPPLIPTTLT